jgi:hypothetical protein
MEKPQQGLTMTKLGIKRLSGITSRNTHQKAISRVVVKLLIKKKRLRRNKKLRYNKRWRAGELSEIRINARGKLRRILAVTRIKMSSVKRHLYKRVTALNDRCKNK